MAVCPTRTLLLASLLVGGSASAATLYGADYAGADLQPEDGDVLEGSFTNVGTFFIPGPATVRVAPGVALEVTAVDVAIMGTLSANGSGDLGGALTPIPGMGADPGQAGTGLGAGGRGGPGACTHGGGGGGGGFGGVGGQGAHHLGQPGAPGSTYGSAAGPFVTGPFGSGGGGGGTSCTEDGQPGGAGGGSIFVDADMILIGGSITADGGPGGQPLPTGGPGGGGSGGSVVLVGLAVTGGGNISARGGAGGDATGGVAGGGGGGGGGRIKIVNQVGVEVASTLGGVAGVSVTPDSDADNGAEGTVNVSYNVDSDGDGIPSDVDNCVLVSNVDQDDADLDNVGDICDDCPNDPDNDVDRDGVCGDVDLCPTDHDDNDGDGDGVADGCDICLTGDDTLDNDLDGVPNACDQCAGSPDSDDIDLDGTPDACDNCFGLSNPDQINDDSDPYGAACDCDDNDPTAFAGAPEVCDGVDNDCDGIPDGPDAEGQTTYHPDFDHDGFGSSLATKKACFPPLNYIEDGSDCDDSNASINDLGEEICDGVDNNCDSQIDEGLVDCLEDTGLQDAESPSCGCTVSSTNPANILWILGILAVVFRRRI